MNHTLRWTTLVLAVAASASCVLSYRLSIFLPVVGRQSKTEALLTATVERMPLLSEGGRRALVAYTTGHSFLADPLARLIAYNVPVVVSTVIAVGLALLFVRTQIPVDRRVTRSLTIAAIVVAVIQSLSLPIFTRDMWLSVAWGRMVTQGVNPYYIPMLDSAREGLPFSDRMINGELLRPSRTTTYGPLWAIVSGGMALLAPHSGVAAFLASKLVLLAAWLATLFGVAAIARRRSERHAAVAITLFSFLPLSQVYSLAEGHNDIAMVAPMTFWLAWATLEGRRRLAAPFALLAAVLVKYICAPLGLLELLSAMVLQRINWKRYALVAVGCIAATVAVFAPFFRDLAMFSETAAMRGWGFLSPSAVIVDTLGLFLGATDLPVRAIKAVVLLLGLAASGLAVRRFLRIRTAEELGATALIVMWAVLFSAVGHAWPWFMLWPLPFACVLWHRPIGRAYLAIALLTPLLNFAWLLAKGTELWISGAGLLFFGTSAVAVGLLRVYERRRARSSRDAIAGSTARERALSSP